MNIAIIGSGNVGGALAARLSDKNHKILLGVRNKNEFKNNHLLGKSGIEAHTIEDAVQAADVIIIASPASVTVDLGKQIAPYVGDKVIIDTTNAMFGAPNGYTSSFVALQDSTKSPHLVKCFNSTFAANMAQPEYGPEKADMFIAGSSQKAKDMATKLSKDVGFGEVYDCGGDDKVPLVEALTGFVVNLAYGQGMGPTFGIKLLKR